MTEPLIRDIPSIKKAIDDLKGFGTLKRVWPFLRPIFRLLGADVKQINESLAKVKELEREMEQLASIPDQFNDIFAQRAWIIYDRMNLEIAKAAIEKSNSINIDGAEEYLVNYYSPETVSWHLQNMLAVESFRARIPLAQKALIDYREERYHACVPVVLALLDGLVNELHERRRGFFAEDVDLEAWDSIAAHSKGLKVLTSIFQKGRYKTCVEQISIPYRNGIMHGMDLGYDNKTVAAKTWAALFATREWAAKAELGLLKAPPKESEKTWGDFFQQFRELADDKTRLNSWEPRSFQLGTNLPIAREADVFESGTPEHKLTEFLSYWKARNYGYMARCLPTKTGFPANKLPSVIKGQYASRRLNSFDITEISDTAPAVTEIKTVLKYEEEEEEAEVSITFRMIYEDANGNIAVRGKAGYDWIVSNWMI